MRKRDITHLSEFTPTPIRNLRVSNSTNRCGGFLPEAGFIKGDSMKTEVKKIDASKREINVEVGGDIVKNKFEEVFKEIGQKAKVPGFRVGHVPQDILEKHFSSDAHRRVVEELIPDVYTEAVKKEGLEVIELPNISDVDLRRDSQTLSFKATVEVRPEIKLKDYNGIKINYKKIEVAPDEIKRNIDS